MEKTLPELFIESHSDATVALNGIFHVPKIENIKVLYNQEIGSSWGRAEKYNYSPYTTIIKLSKNLCQNTNPNAILNTMIHEIIHCCGIWNHGHNFKLAANIINNRFPQKYFVSRCTSINDKMNDEQMNKSFKYILMCPECSRKWGYNKLSKYVLFPNMCYCIQCKKNTGKIIHLIREK